jgi:hypothetical protein
MDYYLDEVLASVSLHPMLQVHSHLKPVVLVLLPLRLPRPLLRVML